MNATLQAATATRTEPRSLDQWSDEQLLLQYRETGGRELFAELVHRYESELYGYLRRYLGSVEAAEDAFQTVFLQVHLKCDQFDPQRRVRPWLYAIATNLAIDAQRGSHRHRAVSLDRPGRWRETDEGRGLAELMVSDEPDPLDQVADDERDELLKRAMDELSEQMRSVVQLVYYQGLRYREAAEVLSIPVGTVRSRLHTAIAKLTEFWNRHHPNVD
jgi:RNA polymerase sigma-70 factor (ECF subfamily)